MCVCGGDKGVNGCWVNINHIQRNVYTKCRKESHCLYSNVLLSFTGIEKFDNFIIQSPQQ